MDEPPRSRYQLERDIGAWIGFASYGKSTVKRFKLLPRLRIVQEHLEELGDGAPRDYQIAAAVKRAFAALLPEDNQEWEVRCLRILVRLEGDGTKPEVRRSAANELTPSPSEADAKGFIPKWETTVLIPYLADLIIANDPGDWVDDRPPSKPRKRGSRDANDLESESEPESADSPPSLPHRGRRALRPVVGLALVAIMAVIAVQTWPDDPEAPPDSGFPTTVPVKPDPTCRARASSFGSEPLPRGESASDLLAGRTRVANLSADSAEPVASVDADVGDVVQVQIYNSNVGTKPISDLEIRAFIPSDAASKQEIRSVRYSFENGTEVEDAASITLNDPAARLQFIPGSVELRRRVEVGTNRFQYCSEGLGDDLVFRSTPMGTLLPGDQHATVVTALLRVVITENSIQSVLRNGTTGPTSSEIDASTGDLIQLTARLINDSRVAWRDVRIFVDLPTRTSYVPSSARLTVTDLQGNITRSSRVSSRMLDGPSSSATALPSAEYPGLRLKRIEPGETVDLTLILVLDESEFGERLERDRTLAPIAAVYWPGARDRYDLSTIRIK